VISFQIRIFEIVETSERFDMLLAGQL